MQLNSPGAPNKPSFLLKSNPASLASSPTFGGNLSELNRYALPTIEYGNDYYDNHYLHRPDPSGGNLEANILARILQPDGARHTLITGVEGVGKTALVNKLKRDLEKQGVPSFVTLANSGWKPSSKEDPDLDKFLEEHASSGKRAVLIAQELGLSMLLDDGVIEEKLKKITQDPRYGNVVILGETLGSILDCVDDKYKTFLEQTFPKDQSGANVALTLMTPEESVEVVKNTLSSSRMAGFTEDFQQRLGNQIRGTTLVARDFLKKLAGTYTDWVEAHLPGRQDNSELETIPPEVFDTALKKLSAE